MLQWASLEITFFDCDEVLAQKKRGEHRHAEESTLGLSTAGAGEFGIHISLWLSKKRRFYKLWSRARFRCDDC